MNAHIKRAAEVLLPQRAFTTIQSIRSRNYQMRLHKEWGVSQATQEMVDRYGSTVLHGPFRGLRYPKRSLLNRNGIPILFGTYELELHPIIEEVARKRYDCIIDIGSAEGYYAVGFAVRTKTHVHAFDCEPRERHYLRQMAQLNGVADLVRTGSWFDARMLLQLVRGRRCLVISDCEGYEFVLFNDACAAALKASDLIIELHENGSGNARNELLRRFQTSHRSRIITFPAPSAAWNVPERWLKFAREFRQPGQQWSYLSSTVRAGAS
jgi:hypothetical protein